MYFPWVKKKSAAVKVWVHQWTLSFGIRWNIVWQDRDQIYPYCRNHLWFLYASRMRRPCWVSVWEHPVMATHPRLFTTEDKYSDKAQFPQWFREYKRSNEIDWTRALFLIQTLNLFYNIWKALEKKNMKSSISFSYCMSWTHIALH